MIRTVGLLCLLAAASTAHAQADDSLVWVSGASTIAGIEYWDMASFDVDGTPGLAYNRRASGSPEITSVIILPDGSHVTTEAGNEALVLYQKYNLGDIGHLFPAGGYNPFWGPPYAPQSPLVASESGLDNSLWMASESGYIFRYNPAADEENVTIGQDIAVAFPTPPGSALSDFELSDTHMYAFIEDAANNVTIYRQRLQSPEPMTVVASDKPYQALTILDDGALILADVEFGASLVRAGALTRTGGAGPTWSVALDKPVLDLKALGGFIWMLDANGDVYKIDPADGSGAGMAFFNTGIESSLDFARGTHSGTEDYVIPDDVCPTDPGKFNPGLCGCEYVEYTENVYDDVTYEEATACVHYTATVDINSQISARAHIGKNASVGAFAVVGNDAFVGDGTTLESQAQVLSNAIVQAQSTIETDAVIYPGAIIRRGARVENCAAVWPGAVVGRRAVIGEGAMLMPNSAIGYAVNIPADSEIGTGTILGNLVTFPTGGPVYIGANGPTTRPAIIGRSSAIGAGSRIYAGAILGPETLVGDAAVVGESARIRRNTQIGAGAYIEPDVRIGRDANIGAGAGVAGPSNLRTLSIIEPNVCVEAGTGVPARTTVTEPACTVPFNDTHLSNWDEDFSLPDCGFGPPT